MSGIYLSYRRMEAGGHAGRLVDYLSRHFGRGSVFRDIDTIRRGEDFAEAIESALNACDVVLVVIGNTWATSTGQDGRRRLDDPNDWVRLEVAAALRRDVLVIPVLVDGARLPEPSSLPEELRPLCRRNACELSDLRWVFDVGELVKDLKKVVRPPPRLKLLRGKDKMLRWFAGSAVALVLLLVMILIGPAILKVHLPGPNSLISPTATPIVSGPVHPVPSQDKQPAPSPKDGAFRQETKAPGVVAELTRFVRTGNLVTAEVTLRNTGSLPAKFSCGGWQLIDEQTGGKSSADLAGGVVSIWAPQTLAAGATHVTWAKFKLETGDLSGSKYSVNIESILNRPFEPLALTEATSPQPSQQETRVAGVVAELTRFVRAGNFITAEVTLRNTGSLPATFTCDDWQLIDEQTGGKSSADLAGGVVSIWAPPQTLAAGATHVTWAKFKLETGDLSGSKYSVNIESILNRPFEGLALTEATPPQPSQQETRVAGVVAELTRFVRAGNLITAEVTLRNTTSLPAKFSCDGWQLIDEQTGGKSSADLSGGVVSIWVAPETLAAGATHVTWAKFKTQPGDLSGNKYSVNIESILNRPFEGLALKSQ